MLSEERGEKMNTKKEYLVFCEIQYECYRGMAGVKARVWGLENAQRAALEELKRDLACWFHIVNLTDGVYTELDVCNIPYNVDSGWEWVDRTLRKLIDNPQHWEWEPIPNWSSVNAKHIERGAPK